MIDYFALGLTHALILIALIRLVSRKVLDEDPELESQRKARRAGARHAQRKPPSDA